MKCFGHDRCNQVAWGFSSQDWMAKRALALFLISVVLMSVVLVIATEAFWTARRSTACGRVAAQA
jgi:hypothetical protein